LIKVAEKINLRKRLDACCPCGILRAWGEGPIQGSQGGLLPMSSAYHLGGAGQDDRKLIFSAVGLRRIADVYHKTDPITPHCVGRAASLTFLRSVLCDKSRGQL